MKLPLHFLPLVASAAIPVDAFVAYGRAKYSSKRRRASLVTKHFGNANRMDNVTNEFAFFNSTTFPERRNAVDELEIIADAAAQKFKKFDVSKLEFVPACGSNNPDACSVDGLYEMMEEESHEEEETSYPYVDMIRGSAPYIANHRGDLMVVHVPGDLLAWSDLNDFMNDISLCWLLGMKVVIVVGCRKQVDDRLKSMGLESKISGHTRITTVDQMRIIQEEAGYARFEMERLLHRSLRCSQLSALTDGNVVSGNFFKASPFGIVDGVDFESTGRPTKLNVRPILDYLQNGEIVLMTSVGIGRNGECLNVNSDCLAAFTAASLCANKLVFCSNNGTMLRHRESQTTVQNFRAKEARIILEHFSMDIRNDYFMTHSNTFDLDEGASEMLVKIGWACKAIREGVERAHIIAPSDGALIEELFTAKQGTGTCISDDAFQSVHPDDDSGDYELANQFEYTVQAPNDPDWPSQVPATQFPWQSPRPGSSS